ncbi:hypothetical protein SAMN04489723_12812 [Algoriphagus aquimarinus]|uniref:Uncharacterized protein n=1 Tax=Algoriphagus aquimarinus TaxID=237018 RepID=A0A1I1CBC8_9BACT|nr:hypothetical protein SAMN04489723_12812 [Algoriphagus aquimarinus]
MLYFAENELGFNFSLCSKIRQIKSLVTPMYNTELFLFVKMYTEPPFFIRHCEGGTACPDPSGTKQSVCFLLPSNRLLRQNTLLTSSIFPRNDVLNHGIINCFQLRYHSIHTKVSHYTVTGSEGHGLVQVLIIDKLDAEFYQFLVFINL